MAPSRILLAGGGTGGHLYPALNLAEALGRLAPDVECVFLGGQRGIEARVLPDAGYAFRLLPLEPLYRQRPWRNWRLLASAPAVVAGVRRAFRDFDPSLVVGTGGYVSGPALAGARLTGRRTAVQEQNAEPGLVTRLFAPRVDQIHLGYPEAETRLKVRARGRVYALGNPVALPPREASPDRSAEDFEWPGGKTLLVFGGSQGARGLNHALLSDLEAAAGGSATAKGEPVPWPDGVSVVWIAGRDHADEVTARAAALPWAEHIEVVAYIDELGRQLAGVTLALCRSGAMSVAELCAAGRPAVLIPLPASAAGHQLSNARALVEGGAAEMREESELARGELWSLCREILVDDPRIARMAAAAKRRGRPDAALAIAGELLTLLDGRAA